MEYAIECGSGELICTTKNIKAKINYIEIEQVELGDINYCKKETQSNKYNGNKKVIISELDRESFDKDKELRGDDVFAIILKDALINKETIADVEIPGLWWKKGNLENKEATNIVMETIPINRSRVTVTEVL